MYTASLTVVIVCEVGVVEQLHDFRIGLDFA